MFQVSWTRIEATPAAEAAELYTELSESIALDGPTEFAVLVYAARLLETGYVLARAGGFPDRELVLDYTDIVELFEGLDEALAALRRSGTGLLGLYPGIGADYLPFECRGAEVRLHRVPWRETTDWTPGEPLPERFRGHPVASRPRDELIEHLAGLRGEFAATAIRHDPRLAGLEPIRRWNTPRPPAAGRA